MDTFWLAFIPLFVAVDALGVLPIYLSITDGLGNDSKKKLLRMAVVTAFLLAMTFIFLGKAMFAFLGISVGDFMVAGGFLLFAIAVTDMVGFSKVRRNPADEDIPVVPLGTPLIVGPAVLTTLLLIVPQQGILAVTTALVINLILAGLIFSSADILIKLIGHSGARTLSKVTSLFLAAIAVMMIRKGITAIIKG